MKFFPWNPLAMLLCQIKRKCLNHLLLMIFSIDLYLNNNQQWLTNATNTAIYHRYNHHRGLTQSNKAPYQSEGSSENYRKNFENAYKEAIGELCLQFNKQHNNFDVFFRQILKISHGDFHRMFSDTYGILYDKHSYIFNQMFRNLEDYYSYGLVDVSVAMKEFFSLLYKKMFEELNAQYSFDVQYLNCTVEHMEEMMPFGELPQKLILQVKRAFVAIRTFVQTLNYIRDTLKTIMELPVTSTCEKRLHSISYCQKCSTETCQNECVESIERSCLLLNHDLNREWNNYLNNMTKLANRLKTSFNIEHIVSPIHIQISDAIMNFQEKGRTISQKLFEKCGRPFHRKRDKRSEFYLDKKYSENFDRQSPVQQLNIDTMIEDITKDLRSYKNFWSYLPKKLCSSYKRLDRCSSSPKLEELLNYRDKNNLEIMNQQTNTLKLISNNLNNAYNGLDVDFDRNTESSIPIDDDDSSGDGSGSGQEPLIIDQEFEPDTKPSGNANSDIDISTRTKNITKQNSSTIMTPSSSARSLIKYLFISYNSFLCLAFSVFFRTFI